MTPTEKARRVIAALEKEFGELSNGTVIEYMCCALFAIAFDAPDTKGVFSWLRDRFDSALGDPTLDSVIAAVAAAKASTEPVLS